MMWTFAAVITLCFCVQISTQHGAYPPGVPPPNNAHGHAPPVGHQAGQQFQGQQQQQFQGQQQQQFQQGQQNQQFQQGQQQHQQNLQFQQGQHGQQGQGSVICFYSNRSI